MFTVQRRLPTALAFAGVLMFSAPLFAQDWRYPDRYPDRRGGYPNVYSNEAQYRAYDRGFRKGEDKGRDDARHRRVFNYARYKEYRRADDGYKGRYGPRDWYRDEYRRGFLNGYTRGYQAYARRGYDRDDRWYRWER